MSYYDYNYFTRHNIGFAWLDIADRIKNALALGLCRNITEYWTQEISCYTNKITCNKDTLSILNWAESQNLDFVIVSAIGTNLSGRGNILNNLAQWFDENRDNITVVGHILDKKDRYYELHHQFFIVNVKWWISVGRPDPGQESFEEWQAEEPVRSQENWHDDYTPYWISPGSTCRTYSGRRWGWKLIKAALDTGHTVRSLTEQQRNTKFYLYPEVPDYYTKLHDIIFQMQMYGHFVANTESVPTLPDNVTVDTVVTTGGGVSPLLSAYLAGLKPGGKVIVFDCSPISIAIQSGFRNKKATFKNFREEFRNLFNEGLPYENLSAVFKAEINVNRMQEIIDELMPQGLEDFINNVWPNLCYLPVRGDFFNPRDIDRIFDKIEPNEKVLINLSNVFHYQNSAWFYDSASRYSLEKMFLDKCMSKNPDNIYLYQNRAGRVIRHWRGQTAREIFNDSEFLKQVDDLKELSWIKA